MDKIGGSTVRLGGVRDCRCRDYATIQSMDLTVIAAVAAVLAPVAALILHSLGILV